MSVRWRSWWKRWKKGNITLVFKKCRKEDQELQTGDPYLCAWKGNGTDLHGNYVKGTHEMGYSKTIKHDITKADHAWLMFSPPMKDW